MKEGLNKRFFSNFEEYLLSVPELERFKSYDTICCVLSEQQFQKYLNVWIDSLVLLADGRVKHVGM